MNTATDIRTALLHLLIREQELAREENSIAHLLDISSLVASGKAIRNMFFVSQSNSELHLRCEENASRFRAGDIVEISSQNAKHTCRIIEIDKGGKDFHLLLRRKVEIDPSDHFTLVETDSDIISIYITALYALSPGAPGWWVLDVLAGTARGKRIVTKKPKVTKKGLVETLCSVSGIEVDERSRSVLRICLGMPRIMGVQGPPGTGKTILLALAAEGLARQGKRVAIVAHTHQAVNNALSCCYKLFPERRIAKIGSELRREGLDDNIPSCLLKDESDELETERMDATIYGLTFASATAQLCIRNGLLTPHAVLLDEAGQIPFPYASSIGLTGASSYIFFGDDKQMPPVFRIDSAENPFAVSLFTKFQELYPEYVHQLVITHRLNDELCMAISKIFYEQSGLLPIKPSKAAQCRKLQIPKTNHNVISKVLASPRSLSWIDSPDPDYRQNNPWEAEKVKDLIVTCLHNGVAAAEMAVVAPFRQQVALIRSMLSTELGNHASEVIVDTVERVQGMTVNLIVLSATASDPDYIAETGDFMFSPNRLNVSLSRARTKAVIFASPSLLKAVPLTKKGLDGQRCWAKAREYALVYS